MLRVHGHFEKKLSEVSSLLPAHMESVTGFLGSWLWTQYPRGPWKLWGFLAAIGRGGDLEIVLHMLCCARAHLLIL
jgi:hypothetical protein